MSETTDKARTIKVWDLVVRVFHWSLVVAFAVAWLFPDDDYEAIHRPVGYLVMVLIAVRLAWGIWGSRYARFAQFVRGPAVVVRYLADIAKARELRYLGHNPAGGAMVVALLATVGGICLSGWLMTTDAFWGSGPMEMAHETLTNIALGLIALHIAGVVLACVRHRENLVRAMFTGRKRPPADGDVA